MSMFNNIVWKEPGNTEKCVENCFDIANYAPKFLPGHWSFLGPGSEKTFFCTYAEKPDGQWTRLLN